MSKNIFLIGPASVGKSTVGEILAKRLGYNFVDIDLVFCKAIALISDYINEHGYVAYCQRNSTLVDELIARHPSKTVFATPSGFLVHEDSPELIKKHLQIINKNAYSVLLLPSEDPLLSAELIANRQATRWPEMSKSHQHQRYIARHAKYKHYGSVKIIGLYTPEETVELVIKQLP